MMTMMTGTNWIPLIVRFAALKLMNLATTKMKTTNLKDWTYRGKVFIPDETFDPKRVYGFVYLITNEISGRKYIGRKYFWSPKTRMVNKKKKQSLVESDWMDYSGSSVELNEDIANLGPENFSREIIHLCATKTHCAYMELKEQIDKNVLLDQTNFYNGFIGTKINRMQIGKVVELIKEQCK